MIQVRTLGNDLSPVVRQTSAAPSLSGKSGIFQPFLDNIGRTPDAGGHRYCGHRTVGGAGAALHTGVKISNNRLAVPLLKNGVRADHAAHGTADTGFLVKNKG